MFGLRIHVQATTKACVSLTQRQNRALTLTEPTMVSPVTSAIPILLPDRTPRRHPFLRKLAHRAPVDAADVVVVEVMVGDDDEVSVEVVSVELCSVTVTCERPVLHVPYAKPARPAQ